jgi:hypothetical protein
VTPEPRAVRVALAVIAACTSAAALYALLRLGQKLLGREPDPALVLYVAHAGFFWRSWTSAYAGGMVGLLAWLASARDADRVARALARAVAFAAALLTVQALLVP